MDSLPFHILIVDDDESVREIIREMLESVRYRVTTADGGVSMCTFIENNEGIDGVILDVDLPGEKCPSLAFRLLHWGIPVLLLSGSVDVTRFADQNSLEILWKPFRFAELIAATGRVLQADLSHRKRPAGLRFHE